MSALRAAILAIDALVPSIVVDYRLHIEGPAGDAPFLDSYFEMHETREASFEDWLREIRSDVSDD